MWICGCYAEALEACGLAFTLMLRVPQHDNALLTMSLRGTKQSHGEKRLCIVRDCFVPRNDNYLINHSSVCSSTNTSPN